MSDPDLEIPGYEILGRIGEGGMGTVYRARQLSLDRLVAIKVLRPEIAKDAEFAKKFLHEARAAAKLSHPHIVQAIEAGEHNGVWYFVMELVEAGTLHDRFVREGKISELDAVEIGLQIAQALDFAWRRARIVHRDIKPANILLTPEGQTKVADLGLAHRQGTLTAKDGFAEGTPQYCSPEQCRAERDLDTRTDLYALGCTLYHGVCGRPPFDDKDPLQVMAMQIYDAPEAPRKLNSEISPEFEAFILKLIAKNPADRYQTPAEAIAELERIYALRTGKPRGGPRTAARPPETRASRPPARRSAVGPLIGLAVLMVVTGAAGYKFFQQRRQHQQQTGLARSPALQAVRQPGTNVVLIIPRETNIIVRPSEPLPAPATNVPPVSIPAPAEVPMPAAALSNNMPPVAAAPATGAMPAVVPVPDTNMAAVVAPDQPSDPDDRPILLAQIKQLMSDVDSLQQSNKFVEAETVLTASLTNFAARPVLQKLIEARLDEVKTARAEFEKKQAEAERARLQQLDAAARSIVAPADPLVRTFNFERAQQYVAALAAKTTDPDLRPRIQARADELQLLVELKTRLTSVISKGAMPARNLNLRTGGAINGRLASADADTVSIALASGAGSIALPWGHFAEQTLYELLHQGVTYQDGRALAAMALYAWETGRAADAKRYYDAARAVLGDANIPPALKRRAGS